MVLTETALDILSDEDYSLGKEFFKDFNVYATFLHSILEQRSVGTVYTDNKNNPAYLLACTSTAPANLNSPVYLAGKFDQTALQKIIAFLKTLPKTTVVAPRDWIHIMHFEKAGFKTVERLQLRRPNPSFDSGPWIDTLAAHFSISEINDDNFSQCNWGAYALSIYAERERFFKNALGICLLDQGNIASEAYGFIANGFAEMGVITDPKYRGHNLGTILSAILIDFCCKRHLEPIWNCDVQNPASAAIAKKLGFVEERTYLALKWVSQSQISP